MAAAPEKVPPEKKYDEAVIKSLASQLFERLIGKFPGTTETADRTKGLSGMSKDSQAEMPFESGLIGEFENPWDSRKWKILGMRTKREMDGVTTEYDVLRLVKKFNTHAGLLEELSCRERKEHVLKVCRKDDSASHNKFYHEFKVLQEMRERYVNYRQSRHFPALFGIGLFEEFCFKTGKGWRRVYSICKLNVPRPYFIQERIDPNLETVMKMMKNTESNVLTAAYLTIGMLKPLRLLHMAGYCHRRIMPCVFGLRLPPDHMVVRNEAELANCVVLIDVAIARKYRDQAPRRVAPFVGTMKYSSPNVMELFEATACDDVISTFFVFFEMACSFLPWFGNNDKKAVLSQKKSIMSTVNVTDPNGNVIIAGYSQLFDKLTGCDGFVRLPPYEELYSLLRNMTDGSVMDFSLFGNRRDVKKQYLKDVQPNKKKGK